MISLMDVQRGYDDWAAQPHNKKWVKRLDGTPIANDIVVRIFEALKDAAPAPLPVAVKALEWNPYRAETPFGWYEINDQRGVSDSELKGRPPFLLCGSRMDYSRYHTLEAARSAAQADYEARIRSALSSPVGGTANDEMNESLWRFWNDKAKQLASDIAALREENRRLRNKVPARALTDGQLDDEAAAIDEVMAGGFGEGGGSPGEWWYERADEIDHERKRRQLEKDLADHNRSALQHVAKGERE
ncbi:hypothetical protein FBZ98_101985 [Rhizobium sp. ERR 922]|uniref:hypothetical protein n=1 Tax=unclassified Rhizobium TaxID=2613769 RepID=UPI0011A6A7E8|nr:MULTISPECIES: hypothetical protein [unclassified Rhizobium]TWB61640.1 hypothetical protein FBZ98_101985 [Rhizobium sp. ERR 922]TWC04566.1 hypothetical protein FBZ97_101985 [Rhizobium sp. ERR 942]